MTGRAVTRIAGWDTHGLPVEISVEKELGISCALIPTSTPGVTRSFQPLAAASAGAVVAPRIAALEAVISSGSDIFSDSFE